MDRIENERDVGVNARPPDWTNPKVAGRYCLVIIGGGPAGLCAAREAAALGARVALIERYLLGGLSLNYGCIPSQALIRSSRLIADMRNAIQYGVRAPKPVEVDFPLIMERMRRICARISQRDSAANLAAHGIDVFFGSARFVGDDTVNVDGARLRFDKALIATGSRSMLPTIPGLTEAGFLTNETVFDLKALPKSLLVIGGGPVGCELAQVFCRFGSRTIITHDEPLFLPKEERDAALLLAESLARDGVEFHLNTRAVKVSVDGGRKVIETLNDGNSATIIVDEILTGIGRMPVVAELDLEAANVAYDACNGIEVDDFLRSTNPRIYAAGDVCLDHQFTDTARASASIAVRNALLLGRQRVSALTIPWCTYTDPEIAHVGLYVRQARERGIPVKTFSVPMHEVDRAITDSEEDGFVKVHVREGTDKILGATVVARHAGEMINDLSLAMVAGIGLDTIAHVMHAYPTQAEAIKKAAIACEKSRTAPWMVRLSRWWIQRGGR